MTHKHFQAIADVFRETYPIEGTDPQRKIWRQTAIEMADMLAGQNPRFDRDRFLNACHPVTAETV